ncbi:MAG: TetR/AcrR family transcriptional regulator [Pseudomonadota bacterium]
MADKMTREQGARARRQALVEAAAACFAEKGFHQTSMRDLAERAGVSLGNLYNHFKSKTDIIREIARLEADGLNALQAELAGLDDPAQFLDRFVQLYVSMCAEWYHASITAEIVSEGLRNPEICEDFLSNRRLLVARLAESIDPLMRATPAVPGLPSSVCAEFVLDLVESVAMRCAFEGGPPGKESIAELKTAVQRLIGTTVPAAA